MKLDSTIDIKKQLGDRMFDLFNQVTTYRLSSEQFNEKYTDVWENLPMNTPQWIKHYLDGMREMFIRTLYSDYLEFCYEVDGKLYSMKKTSKRYYGLSKWTAAELFYAEVFGYYYCNSDKLFFGAKLSK